MKNLADESTFFANFNIIVNEVFKLYLQNNYYDKAVKGFGWCLPYSSNLYKIYEVMIQSDAKKVKNVQTCDSVIRKTLYGKYFTSIRFI